MTDSSLEQSIRELKVTINEALNEHERDLFGDLMTRMAGGSVDETVHSDLASKATEFEVSHPHVARSIREVMDSLSKMGI
jgi:hypothetical protein